MKNWQKILVSVIILVAVAGLAVALGITVKNEKEYSATLDNIYKKSYYDARDTVSDTEMKLSKLTLSEGANTQRTLLYDIWLDSEQLSDKLSTLSAKDLDMSKIIKFVNQLGDYCYYLANRLQTKPLAAEDRQKLSQLYAVVVELENSFSDIDESLINGETLSGKLNGGIKLLGTSYEHFNNDSTVEYPEMIYDGPFSDGLSDREAKFLHDKTDVNEEEASAIVKAKFAEVGKIELLTETSGSIASYMYYIEWKEGAGSVQVTKKGGLITQYTGYREIVDPVLTEEECKTLAIAKVKAMGYNDMKCVWVSNSHSTVYVNFAYEKDNIIYYPDLVKVKIASDTGHLIGLEAANYIYNHTERATVDATYPIEAAREKLSSHLNVKTSALTVIPTEWNSEILAYEFSGTYNGGQYYVYIEANTLEEIKVMRVIEEDGGLLIS